MSQKFRNAAFAAIDSHKFLSAGASASVSNLVEQSWGNGVSGYGLQSAAASATAGVSAVAASASATAGAMDAYGVKLPGGVEMQAFLEAMASGSVKAGINGIQLQGYAGISNGIKITEQQSFSLGGGVQMLQTTDVGYQPLDVGHAGPPLSVGGWGRRRRMRCGRFAVASAWPTLSRRGAARSPSPFSRPSASSTLA